MLSKAASDLLEWLEEQDVSQDLIFLVISYIKGRGAVTMEEICYQHSLPNWLQEVAKAQDTVGWRRFMEGMVAKRLTAQLHSKEFPHALPKTSRPTAHSLVRRLLEITHGLWIYRNLLIHEDTAGILASTNKERIAAAIEEQIRLGPEGLREEDHWMLEVDLNDLETSKGEKEAYWVLAIRTARERCRLHMGITVSEHRDG